MIFLQDAKQMKGYNNEVHILING